MKLHVRLLSLSAVALLAATAGIGCAEVPDHLLGSGGGDSSNDTTPSSSAQGTGGSSSATGTGGDGGGSTQTASFEVSVDDDAPQLELRATTTLTVSIAANGYQGDVLLHVDGLPADVDAQLSSSSVTLAGSGTETVGLTLTSASTTTTGTFAFQISGTSPDGTKSAPANLEVMPVITITIPKNLNDFSSDPADTTAFGDYPLMVKALPVMDATHTITVKFYNDDTTGHEIHADQGTEGFGHGTGDIAPGSFDSVVRKINTADTYDYYPHDIGTSIIGRIIVQ
jgi:hypothetical protein